MRNYLGCLLFSFNPRPLARSSAWFFRRSKWLTDGGRIAKPASPPRRRREDSTPARSRLFKVLAERRLVARIKAVEVKEVG